MDMNQYVLYVVIIGSVQDFNFYFCLQIHRERLSPYCFIGMNVLILADETVS